MKKDKNVAYACEVGNKPIFKHHYSNVVDGYDHDTVDIGLLVSWLNLLSKNIMWIEDETKDIAMAHLLAHAIDLGVVTSAVWTTKFTNNLPDSSFAVIERGGKKDEEGKTVPRNYRHLPYKDSNGKVDLSHLRNALARMNQIQATSPKDSTERIRKVARDKLIPVAKKYLPNSKFAKEMLLFNTKAKITKVEIFEQRKIFIVDMEKMEEDGESTEIYSVPFEVVYDGEGEVEAVKIWTDYIPEDFIPDVISFLNNIPKV